MGADIMETSVFWSGNSQAIRLPKDFRIQGDSVDISKKGNQIIIKEKPNPSWAEIFAMPCPEFELRRPDNAPPQERDLF
jgi:antitoxin VapB